jgi:N-acetylglucosamine-6-phosphate deacetylase
MEMPGLVDLQVNGYKGVDFSGSDLTEADFVRACRAMLAAGTTAFLPTMITSPEEVYRRNLPIMAKVIQSEEFRGRLLGIHLEGPFICPDEGARGMHNPDWIRSADVGFFEKLIDWACLSPATCGQGLPPAQVRGLTRQTSGGLTGRRAPHKPVVGLSNGTSCVKLATIAAELEGAEELTRYAVSKGMSVSLGHQMAGEEDLDRLVDAGAVAITHLGNGVPAMLPRHHNPIWAGLAEDSLAAMIITDSHHLPASVVKTIVRAKGPERCVVVSDASPLAGLAPGSYPAPGLPGHKVVLTDSGQLYDPATGYLVGSSATMLQCMNWLASLRLVNAGELAAMAFYNPLGLIGLGAEDVALGPAICFDQSQEVLYVETSN